MEFGGRGRFDGLMTGQLKAPRIEGRFEGDAMRAWDPGVGPRVGPA